MTQEQENENEAPPFQPNTPVDEFAGIPDVPRNERGGVDLEALLRERPIEMTHELKGLGLTEASFPTETTESADVPADTEPAADPIRDTPQFQRAAHHIALTKMFTPEQLAVMEPSEVLRLGEIAGEQVTQNSVLRQQLAEAQKTGEGARAQEAGDAVPDAELESKMRKILEPVYEAEGEKEGDKALRAALKTVKDAYPNPTPDPSQPAAANPTDADSGGNADLRIQIAVARAELREQFPQLADDAKLKFVCQYADTMTPAVPFTDAKSAIEAAATELFGSGVARVQTEAARSNGSPQPPAGAGRPTPDGRTQMDKEFAFYKQIRKNPGDVEGNMQRAGLS